MADHRTLEQIKDMIDKIAKRISPPSFLLPTYGQTQDGARPHIEVNANGYHYMIVERGQELERKTTNHLSELLYWVFASVTHQMAVNYELDH